MRSSNWTPSIVPSSDDQDVCLVVDHFGRRGRAYCETDVEATDLETVIQDLFDGQYSNPVRVVTFNTAEGWSRDISANGARPRPASPGCDQEATRNANLEIGSSSAGLAERAAVRHPVHLVRLTEEREITPYAWVHPDQER
jgi:hypothetical protein